MRAAPPGNPDLWVGSLVKNKRDLTGNLYMRNRYYDAQAGRFSQEDPIGLAGGLIAYGFAAGDPVSYSDPYRLKADSIYVSGSEEFRRRTINMLVFRARNSTIFAKMYNALAGSSTKHILITPEGTVTCPNQRDCTRRSGPNGATISHTITAPSYHKTYVSGAWNIGDGTVVSHELAHAAALLLPESLTGVSADCASMNRSISEPCAQKFEADVNAQLRGKVPTNPEQAVPPNDDE